MESLKLFRCESCQCPNLFIHDPENESWMPVLDFKTCPVCGFEVEPVPEPSQNRFSMHEVDVLDPKEMDEIVGSARLISVIHATWKSGGFVLVCENEEALDQFEGRIEQGSELASQIGRILNALACIQRIGRPRCERCMEQRDADDMIIRVPETDAGREWSRAGVVCLACADKLKVPIAPTSAKVMPALRKRLDEIFAEVNE